MNRILVDSTNPFSIRHALSVEYNEHNIEETDELIPCDMILFIKETRPRWKFIPK